MQASNLTPKEELHLHGELSQETQQRLVREAMHIDAYDTMKINIMEAHAMYPNEDFMVPVFEDLDRFISHYRGKFQGEIMNVREKMYALMQEVNQQAEHGRECLDHAQGALEDMEP